MEDNPETQECAEHNQNLTHYCFDCKPTKLGCDQCFIDHEHGSKNISTFRDFPIFLDKIKILTDEIEKEIAQIDDQSDQIEDKKNWSQQPFQHRAQK